MKGNVSYIFYKFSLLLLFLQSIQVWFLWNTHVWVIPLVAIISISFLLFNKGKGGFTLNKSNATSIVLLIVFLLYLSLDRNLNYFITSIFRIIIFSILILCSEELKIGIFRFLTKSLALILLASMLAWVLHLSGFSLPSTSITYGDDHQYSFRNYYFFLLNEKYIYILFPRFSSIFLEPGHLGMISSLMLFANKFEIKRREVSIILIATLLTFSLVAYILLLISLLIFIVVKSKNSIRNLIIAGVLGLSLISFFSTYNNGDNAINNFILLRMQIEDGDIVGNNRFSVDFENYYFEVMKSKSSFLGVGLDEFKRQSVRNNSGYKVYLVQYGIVGTLITFLFYLSILNSRKSTFAYYFLLVYILCFLQRAYPHWDIEILIFILAVPYLYYSNIGENQKKYINGRS